MNLEGLIFALPKPFTSLLQTGVTLAAPSFRTGVRAEHETGGCYRTRTCDIRRVKATLYQLS